MAMKRIFLGLMVFLLFAGMVYSQQSIFTGEQLSRAVIVDQQRYAVVGNDNPTVVLALCIKRGLDNWADSEFKYVLDSDGVIAPSLFTIVFTQGLSGGVQLGLNQVWQYMIMVPSAERGGRSVIYPLYVYWPSDSSVKPSWYALKPGPDW
jgi:hypothetical protein